MNQQAIIYLWKLRASWDKKLQNIFFNAVVEPNIKMLSQELINHKGGIDGCRKN